ncbi:MAG: response regulator, partial [Spirochaetales bacterium]
RRAVELISEERIDCVLMDVYMRNMDGLDATRSIRKMTGASESSVPVIGLTADAQPSTLEQCRDVGMDDVIIKPVDMTELERIFRQL